MHAKRDKRAKAAQSIWVLLMLGCCDAALAGPVDCDALAKAAETKRALIPSSDAIWKAVGKGRVQFYSAPDKRCPIKGVFIIPGQRANAYADYAGFVNVWYMNDKGGGDAEGWVLESRMKPTGYGIGPN